MQLRKVKIGEEYYSRSAGACDDTKPSVALDIVSLTYSFGGTYKAVRIERPNGDIDDVLPDYLTPWGDHLKEERMFADRLSELDALAKSLSDLLGDRVELEDYYRESAFLKFSEAAVDNLLERLSAKPLPPSCRAQGMPENERKRSVRAKAGARVRRALGTGRAGRFAASNLTGDQAACLICSDDQLALISEKLGLTSAPASVLQEFLA